VCRTDIHLHEVEFHARLPLDTGHDLPARSWRWRRRPGFKVGDRVTAGNKGLCGNCYYCRPMSRCTARSSIPLGCNVRGLSGISEGKLRQGLPDRDHLTMMACFAEPNRLRTSMAWT
jgi:threonine dehydrogenase-like Zn-dependent dehydrogenase